MKALFIGDNRDEFEALKKTARPSFPSLEFILATRGEVALEHLTYDASFSLVILDCNLMSDAPVELVRKIFQRTGERPILFVGTADVLHRRVYAQNIPDNDKLFIIYEKPYDVDRLKAAFSVPVAWNKKEQQSNVVSEIDRNRFLPMKVRNFFLFDKVGYDAYIELTRTKFIKAIIKDKPYAQSVIRDLLRRNISYLYLEKTNYIRFLEESAFKAMSLMQKKNLDIAQTIQVQISATLIIHQYVQDVGVSDTLIELAETVIGVTERVYNHYGSLPNILRIFPFEQADIPEKSILVLYICEAFSRGLGWHSDISRKKLGLASILHDCMLKDERLSNIQSLGSLDYQRLSIRLQEEFKEHPRKAADLATEFLGFSNVEFIIEEHHELPSGKGFPHKRNSSKLTSISSAFIMACNFTTEMAINGISSQSVKKAMASFERQYDIGNFRQPLKVLQKCLKKF